MKNRSQAQYGLEDKQCPAFPLLFLFRLIILGLILGIFWVPAGCSQADPSFAEDQRMAEKTVSSQALLPLLWFSLAGLLILAGALLWKQRKLLRTVRTLQENTRQRETALISGQVGIWEVDIPNRGHFIDEKMARLLGYTPEEVGQDISFWENSVHPEDYGKIMNALKSHQEKGTPFYEVEYRIRNKQNQWLWVWAKGKITARDSENRPLRVSGTLIDITQRKQAEQILRRYEQMISSTRDLMAYVDRNYICQAANAACLGVHGKSRDEVIGHSVENLFEKAIYEETIKPHLNRCLAGEEITDEAWIDLPGVGRRFVQPIYYPVRDEEDRIEGVVVCVHDLTEAYKALEALRRSEEKYRSLVETTSDWIWEVDARGVFTYASPQVRDIIGYEPEEVIGKTPFLFMAPEEAERIKKRFTDSGTAARTIRGLQNAYLHKNGQTVILETNGIPILDEEGRWIGYRGVDRDITARKEAEQELDRRQRQLSSIFDLVPVGISHIKDRTFVRVNQIFCQTLGYAEAELIGKDTSMIYQTKEDVQNWGKVLYDQIGKKTEVAREISFQHKDGHMIDFLLRSVYFDPNDPKKGQVFALTDITERKRAQRVLEFTQFAVDHFGEAAFLMDKRLKYFYVNEEACRSLGYTRRELLTMSVYDIDPDYTKELASATWERLKKEGPQTFETCHRTKDGRIFPVEVTANILVFEGKEYNCAFVRDITERKRAQQALAESEQRFRQMFERMSNAVVIYRAVEEGRDFVITDLNPSVERIEQYRREEILNRRVTEVFPAVEVFGLLDIFRRVYRTGQPAHHPVTQYKDDRISGWRENYVFRLPSGEIVALYDDVTRIKQADEAREKLLKELRTKNEELESIVFIASHDLRSPLVNIEGFTGELKKACQEVRKLLEQVQCSKDMQKQFEYLLDKDIPESIGFISAGTGKMDTLLSGLLRLSRIGTATIHIESVNMKMLLQTVLGAMRFQIRELNVEVSVGELPDCMGDAVQINQVFSNLVDNAIKYRHPDRPPRLQITGAVEGDMAIYAVADNGIGIDPQHHDKIFEIFHQLNPGSTQRGEGLGLTIIRRILARLDGRVWVQSEVSAGSTFFVSLPKAR